MTLPLEKQVVSLDLAKRMKELGAPQESLFYWCHHQSLGLGGWIEYKPNRSMYKNTKWTSKSISAYTVAEVADMSKEVDEPEPYYANGRWYWYKNETLVGEDTQANAYAERWMYIKKEYGLI